MEKTNCEKELQNNKQLYTDIAKLKELIMTVRRARINASERLYNYANHWGFIILMMNTVSSGLLIYSLVKGSSSDSSSGESYWQLFISACFSIYSMIMQFYYSTLNYRERGLKLHYHELELEELIRKLEDLERKKCRYLESSDIDEVEKEYQVIRSLYHKALQDQENHSLEDYLKAKEKMAERDITILAKNLSEATEYFESDEFKDIELGCIDASEIKNHLKTCSDYIETVRAWQGKSVSNEETKVTAKKSVLKMLKDFTGYGELDKFVIRMQYPVILGVVFIYFVLAK